ncbi:putative mitochondrial heat shock protein HslVU [Leptomonas pyrrhocoris]|uniref:Putative mitochondrial heat shock protein HslVU n=1 Tax=Leptomonas pyrrhocoris TaxID=157538 RepID=A0A0N0DTJ0_LEPPY|nr:putative mitochondrial heat shock protein HslVU [Leptomonas pyrrhocoris]KPA77498.1 putative mitochondrial heat shock protein HslVU [Leptomonas pyrrhocoris]|eukprot:XP_015655937.1 putative mitochondrial heat shock protein HslVU [Leptomonas pyrrhocoris]
MFRFHTRRLLCVAAAATTPSPDVLQVTKGVANRLEDLSPRAITEILNAYIVGQEAGKKAVAIALRNRWRRRQLKDVDLRKEVLPKNMLLIGPTGVGKTEISRRMARITDAPFIKVEATKYTEVGFKGKDVESIIEDLYTNAKLKARRALEKERHSEALSMALDTVYSAWSVSRRMQVMDRTIRSASKAEEAATATAESGANALESSSSDDVASTKAKEGAVSDDEAVAAAAAAAATTEVQQHTLEYFREHYEEEPIKSDMVTIDITAPQPPSKPKEGGIDLQSVGMLLGLSGEPKRPKMSVTKRVVDAVPLATQEALDKLIDEASVNTLARALAEEEGVVFVDEIDKVVAEPSSANADVSSTGVQQDLLPLIEGSNVTMKDGSVIATDNILFICSGAFHVAKTSDMIAELQGRLPVRVELQALTENDFRRILTEPKFNLLRQQQEMMKTEGIEVAFPEEGVNALAKVTCAVNAQGQNIGARRLNTVLERVMDEYSFNCEDYAGKKIEVTAKIVQEATEKLQKNVNLAKYLL